MAGDQIGELFHQRRKFLDLRSERLCGLERALENVLDLAVHGIEPQTELGELARQIAGTARQRRDLRAGLSAIPHPRRDRIVDRERGERAERHHTGFHTGKAEAQIKHDAERDGDEHHADGDENRTDAHHAEPRYVSLRTVRAAPIRRPDTL